jgi:hypothetical protein
MNVYATQTNAENKKSSSLQAGLNLFRFRPTFLRFFTQKETAGVSTCGKKDLK